MVKILLADLDGTIRETITGKTFINDPYDQRLMSGVKEAIARYKDWLIIGITNQGGVIAGHKSLEDCFEEQRQTLKLLPEMQMILFCTDNGESMYRLVKGINVEVCGISRVISRVTDSHKFGNFRKPNTGMVNFALSYPGEKADEALFVGDRTEDQQCAQNAGIPFMWAHDWRNSSN